MYIVPYKIFNSSSSIVLSRIKFFGVLVKFRVKIPIVKSKDKNIFEWTSQRNIVKYRFTMKSKLIDELKMPQLLFFRRYFTKKKWSWDQYIYYSIYRF